MSHTSDSSAATDVDREMVSKSKSPESSGWRSKFLEEVEIVINKGGLESERKAAVSRVSRLITEQWSSELNDGVDGGVLSILELLEPYLTSGQTYTRQRSMRILGAALRNPSVPVYPAQMTALLTFLSQRTKDLVSEGGLCACYAALFHRYHSLIDDMNLSGMFKYLLDSATIQNHDSDTRESVYVLIQECFGVDDLDLARTRVRVVSSLSDELDILSGFVRMVQGEKHPRCLLAALQAFSVLCNEQRRLFEPEQITEHSSALFELVSVYFPIEFNAGSESAKRNRNNATGMPPSAMVSALDLRLALRSCLLSHSMLSHLVLPLVLDKFEEGSSGVAPSTDDGGSDGVSELCDVIDTLSECITTFGVRNGVIPSHLRVIYERIKTELFYGIANRERIVAETCFRCLRTAVHMICESEGKFSYIIDSEATASSSLLSSSSLTSEERFGLSRGWMSLLQPLLNDVHNEIRIPDAKMARIMSEICARALCSHPLAFVLGVRELLPALDARLKSLFQESNVDSLTDSAVSTQMDDSRVPRQRECLVEWCSNLCCKLDTLPSLDSERWKHFSHLHHCIKELKDFVFLIMDKVGSKPDFRRIRDLCVVSLCKIAVYTKDEKLSSELLNLMSKSLFSLDESCLLVSKPVCISCAASLSQINEECESLLCHFFCETVILNSMSSESKSDSISSLERFWQWLFIVRPLCAGVESVANFVIAQCWQRFTSLKECDSDDDTDQSSSPMILLLSVIGDIMVSMRDEKLKLSNELSTMIFEFVNEQVDETKISTMINNNDLRLCVMLAKMIPVCKQEWMQDELVPMLPSFVDASMCCSLAELFVLCALPTNLLQSSDGSEIEFLWQSALEHLDGLMNESDDDEQKKKEEEEEDHPLPTHYDDDHQSIDLLCQCFGALANKHFDDDQLTMLVNNTALLLEILPMDKENDGPSSSSSISTVMIRTNNQSAVKSRMLFWIAKGMSVRSCSSSIYRNVIIPQVCQNEKIDISEILIESELQSSFKPTKPNTLLLSSSSDLFLSKGCLFRKSMWFKQKLFEDIIQAVCGQVKTSLSLDDQSDIPGSSIKKMSDRDLSSVVSTSDSWMLQSVSAVVCHVPKSVVCANFDHLFPLLLSQIRVSSSSEDPSNSSSSLNAAMDALNVLLQSVVQDRKKECVDQCQRALPKLMDSCLLLCSSEASSERLIRSCCATMALLIRLSSKSCASHKIKAVRSLRPLLVGRGKPLRMQASYCLNLFHMI